ncbi:hypothetical protein EXU57_14895 [Segetibacter sp. 3557_3]|uniref:hypothetical protein n=1 Tax=Segetibacter sp. 3557_3 TaxID=2547429 RepID=UPI0010589E26|nr:hypothetical protein [Segetibacter sp. 3557_3]TDH24623.1 hypothetical protein EXU57_14895 [Segetibacter sp. 3557_3]
MYSNNKSGVDAKAHFPTVEPVIKPSGSRWLKLSTATPANKKTAFSGGPLFHYCVLWTLSISIVRDESRYAVQVSDTTGAS